MSWMRGAALAAMDEPSAFQFVTVDATQLRYAEMVMLDAVVGVAFAASAMLLILMMRGNLLTRSRNRPRL